jgi:zinc protease
MAYKAPVLRTSPRTRAYALAVLAAVLDGNDSARLKRRWSASGGSRTKPVRHDVRAPGPASWLDGVPAQGRTVAELETALRPSSPRSRTRRTPPSSSAKIQFVANRVYKRDSIFAQASSSHARIRRPLVRDADRILEQVRAVTADEVRAAAHRYLVEDGLTVATLDPQPMDPSRPRVRPAAGRH